MARPLLALLAAAFVATASTAVLSSQEECSDVPLVWTDPDGDSCEVYGRSGWCGAPWTENFATIGRTASQACCVCGGGLRTQISVSGDELNDPVVKPLPKMQADHTQARQESSKPAAQGEEKSSSPAKVKLETPMVGSTSVGSVAIGSFRKDEIASLKSEVAELQNKLKDRDHLAATLEHQTREEATRAKAQESSLDARLSKLEKEFDDSAPQLSNSKPKYASELASSEEELKSAERMDGPATTSIQDVPAGENEESAELMEDVGQIHGLVQQTQAKLRGMSQQIAGLRASVNTLGGL